MRDRVIVVGAGMGGLAGALLLAHRGLDVTVVEAAAGPGGKMRTRPSAAGPIDMGPTVFTMRPIFEELFAETGESLGAHLDLEPVEILARHQWPDGSRLDLHAERARSAAAIAAFAGPDDARAFEAFCERARLLYDAFETPFMRAERPRLSGLVAATAGQRRAMLRAMAPASTLWGALGRQFRDPRLRQLFGRYATYVGGSPFLTPATLLLVWHAEASGVWTVAGGMNRLARVLQGLAEARGARFHFGERAAEILVEGGRAAGVRLAGGERLAAEAVLYNGDPAALAGGLLGKPASGAVRAVNRRRRSLSANVWTFAAPAAGFPLVRHTVFFGGPSRDEFGAIFGDRRAPEDPTVYVCAQDRPGRDAALRPVPERLLVLTNAPADGDRGEPSQKEIEICTMRAFRRLKAAGLELTPPDDRAALTTPADFDRAFPGSGGAIYGRAPHGALGTFARPVATSPLPGLYLAGGGVHPGPGIPMATLSGRFAAAAILRDLTRLRASTARFRPAAMPGGTSTRSRTTAGTG